MPSGVFQYATAQILSLGSHREVSFSLQTHISLSQNLGNGNTYKSEGQGLSPGISFITQLPLLLSLPIHCLILIAFPSTRMKPKASVCPGKTGGSYLAVLCLPLWVQGTPSTYLHHYSNLTCPFSYILFAAEWRVRL